MEVASKRSIRAWISAVCYAVGILFLVACFAASVGLNLTRTLGEQDADREIIRFGHFHLHSGLREAYDLIAEEFMRRNPGIRVEQIDVPIGVFPAWLSTQLVGNHTPDLMLISGHFTDDRLARYVEPITTHLDLPNPYNSGTNLEGVPWRDTFVDGLYGGRSFTQFQKLQEYLSLPTALQTIRVYYNQDLFERITGRQRAPTTFDEFLDLCRDVRNYSATTGETIVPMAGSRYNAIRLLQVLFSSQTQALTMELVDHRIEAVDAQLDVALGFLNGSLSLDHPSLRDACRLSREFCQHMQDGFMQLKREDATFLFARERAVMIVTGSWDITTFQTLCRFTVGIIPVPLPTRDHPIYGRNLLTRPVESAYGHENFGIMSRSVHKGAALAFLHFLTSQSANQILADTSGWVPGIVGVETPAPTKPFMPFLEGYLPGFHFTYDQIGPETTGVFYTYLNRLLKPSGSIDAFIDAMRDEMLKATARDVENHLRDQVRNVARLDTSIAAARELLLREPENGDWLPKIYSSYMGQNQIESRSSWVEYELWRLEREQVNVSSP